MDVDELLKNNVLQKFQKGGRPGVEKGKRDQFGYLYGNAPKKIPTKTAARLRGDRGEKGSLVTRGGERERKGTRATVAKKKSSVEEHSGLFKA